MADQPRIGNRIVVTGLAGSGKSTISRGLAERTGLPLIHLDLHYWRPGWVAPTPQEWHDTQVEILAGDRWIADGNYHETLALRIARADTVVVMDTPWPTCLRRALVRGVYRPSAVMPPGCEITRWRQLRDEWGVASRVVRKRRWEPALERRIIAEHGGHATVHRIGSRGEAAAFLERRAARQ